MLNLSKFTFQHLVKLQEASVSFYLASLSQKCLLNTTRIFTANREDAGITSGFVEGYQAQGSYRWFHQGTPRGNKENQAPALFQFDIDVHLRESALAALLCCKGSFELLDELLCILAQPISM